MSAVQELPKASYISMHFQVTGVTNANIRLHLSHVASVIIEREIAADLWMWEKGCTLLQRSADAGFLLSGDYFIENDSFRDIDSKTLRDLRNIES